MAKKTTPRSAPSRKPAGKTPIKSASKRAAETAPESRAVRPSARAGGAKLIDEEQLLSRAEADIAGAIDGLNRQMNAALATLTELAGAHAEKGRAVIRTAPLDRATATFQRLVSEVVDEHFQQILPPLAMLRLEAGQRAGTNGSDGDGGDEFAHRATETLDHVFSLIGVQQYAPRAGETFDPLIHLAVGEAHRDELPDGAVADTLQPGYRSARGKVLVAAKVRVNRR